MNPQLPGLVALAREAGAVARGHFEGGCATEWKADASPVTRADREAEAVILAGLRRLAPDVPVVAEEEASAGRVPACGDRFFLVDPLDGTREFVSGSGEWTVNIALVEAGAPMLGVVFAPMIGRLFAGDVAAGAAWTDDRPIRVRAAPVPPVACVSRSHDAPATEQWLARLGVTERRAIGSSLKFCLIAAGEADVYPRFTPTMEWDTAAGDAVLRAAGGRVEDGEGAPLRYGKPGHRNGDFVAWGR